MKIQTAAFLTMLSIVSIPITSCSNSQQISSPAAETSSMAESNKVVEESPVPNEPTPTGSLPIEEANEVPTRTPEKVEKKVETKATSPEVWHNIESTYSKVAEGPVKDDMVYVLSEISSYALSNEIPSEVTWRESIDLDSQSIKKENEFEYKVNPDKTWTLRGWNPTDGQYKESASALEYNSVHGFMVS